MYKKIGLISILAIILTACSTTEVNQTQNKNLETAVEEDVVKPKKKCKRVKQTGSNMAKRVCS